MSGLCRFVLNRSLKKILILGRALGVGIVPKEELCKIHQVLSGETKLVGGEHQRRRFAALDTSDTIAWNELLNAGGRNDHNRIELAIKEPVNLTTILEKDSRSRESMSDGAGGINHGVQK